MTPQHSQTPRIQQQPPTSMARRARRTRCPTSTHGAPRMSPPPRAGGALRVVGGSAGGPRERDLLVLAEDGEFGGGEAELRVGN